MMNYVKCLSYLQILEASFLHVYVIMALPPHFVLAWYTYYLLFLGRPGDGSSCHVQPK